MKYFAITPDNLNPTKLLTHLPRLRHRRVTHLYLRADSLHTDLKRLIPLIRGHAIVPIIPRNLYRPEYETECGVHTRSSDRFKKAGVPGLVQTASCHNADQARMLLDSGADYVFISPVYRPLSKPGDMRPLIATETLRMLARSYGERIVLLGGLTPTRIDDLRILLQADFSVAGISIFFTGTANDNDSPADIHQ
jgi:hypothetical protein